MKSSKLLTMFSIVLSAQLLQAESPVELVMPEKPIEAIITVCPTEFSIENPNVENKKPWVNVEVLDEDVIPEKPEVNPAITVCPTEFSIENPNIENKKPLVNVEVLDENKDVIPEKPVIDPVVTVCPFEPSIENPNVEPEVDPIEPFVDGHLPEKVTTSNPNDYSVSILSGNADICKGAVIAPSWILTAAHCVTKGTGYVTTTKVKDKKRIAKKFKFKQGDIALLKIYNAPFKEKNAIKLLAKPLLQEYGVLDNIKVTHNAKRGTPAVYGNLKLRVNNKRTLKSLTPKGKAGSSGSPWVVKTDYGHVVVGVTHGGGRAPQVSQARKWIDKIVKKHTPNEEVNWLEDRDIILEAQ